MPSFTRESGGTLHVGVMGVNRIGKDRGTGIPSLPPREIFEYAAKAVEMDPTDPSAHVAAAYGYYFDGRLDFFERSAERAMELAPNDASILTQMGALLGFMGKMERGIPIVQRANDINSVAAAGWYHSTLFYDHYFNGRYEDALAIIRQHPAQEMSRTRFPWTQNWLNRSVQGGPEHDRQF